MKCEPLKGLLLLCLLAGTLLAFAPAARPYSLLVFEGSDWCSNCKRLERRVLSDTAFAAFLQTQQIQLQRIDFPQQKKLSAATMRYNDSIASSFAFDGVYPAVFLVSPEGRQRIFYGNQSAAEFIALLKSNMQP